MKVKIPLQLIELEEGNYHLFAECTFENGDSGYWAIDTGASKTIFNRLLTSLFVHDEDVEEKKIHSSGLGETLFETTLGTLMPFSMGNFRIEKLQVALIDLSHINRLYHQATSITICGLIGGDFLYRHKAVIDYRKKILVLEMKNRPGKNQSDKY